jgi:hypothetical protein
MQQTIVKSITTLPAGRPANVRLSTGHLSEIRELSRLVRAANRTARRVADEGDAHSATLEELAYLVWKKKPSSLADIIERAELAKFFRRVNRSADGGVVVDYFDLAVDELIRAVFAMEASRG